MKTSDGDLKVNRNIYPDAVICDRMHRTHPITCNRIWAKKAFGMRSISVFQYVGRKKLSVCEKNVTAFSRCGKVL